jgi:Concanavalin A-like lectin/glucanases superfamily
MKNILLRIFSFCAGLLFLQSAVAADTNPPPRLTIELRDGSRVVGTSVEKNFNFHSALLGDLKLAVKDIRSVDWTTTNSAKLTAVNGDTLVVGCTDPVFKIATGFGKVELAANSIRRIAVAAGGRILPRHEGLVAFWSGNGNAKDEIGHHDGELIGDCTFGAGLTGQAFNFSSPTAAVKIAGADDLDVGRASGFTLEAWINPTDVSQAHPIFEWNNSTYWGVHFHIAPGQFFNTTTGPGELYANIPDEHGMWHQLSSPAGVVTENQYQLVALTFNRRTGTAEIYCNGKIVGRRLFGPFIPLTDSSHDLYLGRRIAPEGEASSFAGMIENAAVYNRALSATEIQEDYDAQNTQ